jgi:hypothetical protein
MTLSLPGTNEMREAAPSSPVDVARTTWGTCQIRLVADRIASLRAGSTHKVYRGWRFAVTMDHGCPATGTTLFTVPIDPAQLAASRSRYALVQLANQGDIIVGDTAAFSWSTTSIGTADPFAVGLDEARQHLEGDGWTQDATVPGWYAKPDPTQPEGAQLHGWETEGGMSA